MRRAFSLLIVVLALSAAKPFAQTAAKTLDIYFVDTEGGQATLFVSPTGQTVLVDTGNANPPGRDPQRIMEALNAAGAKQIDVGKLGDQAVGVLVVGTGAVTVRNYAIAWRERNATAELELNGFKLTLQEALALARKQAARLRDAAA